MALVEMRHDDPLALRNSSVYTNELALPPHRVYLMQSKLILDNPD